METVFFPSVVSYTSLRILRFLIKTRLMDFKGSSCALFFLLLKALLHASLQNSLSALPFSLSLHSLQQLIVLY